MLVLIHLILLGESNSEKLLVVVYLFFILFLSTPINE